MKRFLLRRERGLSFVELAVAMAVIGILGVLVWRWVVSTREPLQRPAMLAQLAEAQAAVEGFVLANSTMPCPASDAQGVQACGDADAVFLPWRTLGLGSQFNQIHYGVNRGGSMDLALNTTTAPKLASPDLYIEFTGLAVPAHQAGLAPSAGATSALANATNAIGRAKNTRRAVFNGLDWCSVLRQYAANPTATGALSAGNATDSIPVAYVLVHPGENNRFDGNNAAGANPAWKFDFPGRPQTHDFDDLSLAVGPSDLSARIGCAARLSEMQAAAQGAYAAYDTARVMQEYWSLRLFDITASESAVQSAETGVAVAAMGLALATAGGVLSIASAANTEGVTAFTVAIAAVNLGASIAETVLAAQALTAAEAALEVSRQKRIAADTYAIQVYESFTNALTDAINLDEKGLNP